MTKAAKIVRKLAKRIMDDELSGEELFTSELYDNTLDTLCDPAFRQELLDMYNMVDKSWDLDDRISEEAFILMETAVVRIERG